LLVNKVQGVFDRVHLIPQYTNKQIFNEKCPL